MWKNLILTFLFGLLSWHTYPIPVDTLGHIPDDRFKGGHDEFYKILKKNIDYPQKDRSTLTVGTEIIAFKITKCHAG